MMKSSMRRRMCMFFFSFWSVTVWITFEDTVYVFFLFLSLVMMMTMMRRVISVWLSVTVRRVRSYNLRTIFLGN